MGFVVLCEEGEIIAGVVVAHSPSPARLMELHGSSLPVLWDRAVSVPRQEAPALSWLSSGELLSQLLCHCVEAGEHVELWQVPGLCVWPDQRLCERLGRQRCWNSFPWR